MELDRYGTDGTTLLARTRTKYQAVCPPQGVSGTPSNANYGNWDGNRVTELDHSNPVMVCEVHPVQSDQYTYDGSGGAAVHSATTYAYDSLGRPISQAAVSETGNTAVADASGHGNGAALTGAATENLPGLVGGDSDTATSFDGLTGYAAGPVLTPLEGDNSRSVELWFSTTSSAQQYILDAGAVNLPAQAFEIGLTAAGGVGAGPSVNTPGLYVNFWNDDFYLPGLNLRDGRPHHVVVTLSGTGLDVYVDGTTPNALIWNGTAWSGSTAQPFTMPATANTAASPIWIGHSRTDIWGVGPTFFDGTVDEVAVYDHVLSPARVQAHLTAGSGYRAAVLVDAPTAYYRLDDGTGGPGPNTAVTRTAYVQNDAVTASATSATGHHLIDEPAIVDVEDTAGDRSRCTYTSYDGQANVTGQSSGLTLGEVTRTDQDTGCGTPGNSFTPSGPLTTTHTYDSFGNQLTSTDPDANAGVGSHRGCTVSGTTYSTCQGYDATFAVLPTASSNALNQTSATAYRTPGQTSSTVSDASGHGNQATWSGGVVLGAPGLLTGDPDNGMGFDGSTGAVSTPLTNQTWSQLTVEAWFRLASLPNGPNPRVIASSHTDLDLKGFQLVISSGGAGGFVDVGTGSANLQASWSQQLVAGVPYHYVMTYDGSTVRAYLNGTQVATATGSGSVAASTLPVTVGRDPAYNSQDWFPGVIDEVAVYTTALSASRVGAHAAAGTAYAGSYAPVVLADTPLAYYRLDDSDGAVPAAAGYGLWPVSTTNVNGQTTTTTYDALGRETSTTQPGETAGLTTTGTSYTVWCSGTAAQAPCVEIDQTQRLNSTTAVTSRQFYDGLGHLVETRSPAPGGQDVVRYALRDRSDRLVFQSVPYLVSAYTGVPGAAAYSIPDSTQAGTTTAYDALGRTLTVTDALSHVTSTGYGIACSAPGTGDATCYEQTLAVDGSGHQQGTLTDALGRVAYVQRYTGSSQATYALYATAKYTYDIAGNLLQILQPDGATTTSFQYDMAGRRTAMTDPDLGAETDTYDQDGNLTQSVDARGSSGTIFAGYDGLDRPIWRNTANSPSGAYQTFSYDSTAGGNLGVGELTGQGFSAPGTTLSGSDGYVYDGRGQQTSSTLTVSTGSQPAPAFVQQAANHVGGESSTSLGATLGANVTTGDRLIVVVGAWNNGSVNATSVTDSAGNTYTEVASQTASDSTQESVWTAPVTAGGGTTPTVTAHTDNAADIGLSVLEYSGLSSAAGSAAVDVSATASGTTDGSGGTVSSGATAATTGSGELAVGAYVDSGFDDTLTYGSGWTGRSSIAPAGDIELAAEDQVVGQGSTPNAAVGTGPDTTWLMTTVVFRAATGAPGGGTYTTQTSYDDAGNVLGQVYPDGETVTDGYTAQGWLSSVSTLQGTTTTQLLSGAAYTGIGGGFGELTGASLGNSTYNYAAAYDLLDRATDLRVTRSSDGSSRFEEQRTFDAAGNVSTETSTLPGGTDDQAFCYDEQDRLTWAGSVGTPPCTGTAISTGTLTAAQYTQSFTYDAMGRLASGPLGSYTYGSSAHMHAATSIGTQYTASYDAAGNMTCRAPSSSSTCTGGSPNGAQLGWDNEGRLASWQNQPSSPTSTATFLYDGSGQRVAQQTTTAGTTTLTAYVGDIEEFSTTGSTTTTTAYYYAGGKRIGLSVNGTISYLADDALGSAEVTLSAGGTATASQLFAPYGMVRYSSGTMPGTYGFTGQRADAVSGLDYYGARYYDPLAGQFTTADSVVLGGGSDLWGLSRYAYVEGNPEKHTDSTGHCFCDNPGSGDNFFPQSGGRLLDGNTGDVYSGPGYTQVYHLASWTARTHHYAPIRPTPTTPLAQQKTPAKSSSPSVDLGAVAGAVLAFGGRAVPVVVDLGETAALGFLGFALLPLASPCDSPPCNVTQAGSTDLPLNPDDVPVGGRVYIPPKAGHGKPVSQPHGSGFVDDRGNEWEWARDQHGGPHWDVQHPDGSHTNVAPDGTVIGKDNFPNNDSLKK